MALLRYLDRADLGPDDQDLLARDINLHRLLAHSPGGARAFLGLARYIRHGASPLDPRLRELAILAVGWAARSPYEWSHHIKIGREFGVTDDDIDALIAEAAGQRTALPDIDRLVLQAARHSTEAGCVAPEVVGALRPLLGEAALMDLLLVLAFYAGVVRVLASLQMDVEADYLPYLQRFPLPEGAP